MVALQTIDAAQATELLQAVPNCILCSREGSVRYRDLHDYTFGSSGSWNYRYCDHCQLLWLANRPKPAEMGKYYTTYYTHIEPRAGSWKQNLKRSLIGRTLGSDALYPGRAWRLAAALLSHLPPFSESAQMGSMLLGSRIPGALLDVGCGSGEFLAMMQQAGWEVSGIEPDPKAAQVSSKRLGVAVPAVDLGAASFPPGSFDAITLSHVIEHVYDPVEVLRECRRILKPQGQVVVVTPNIGSLGQQHFGCSWRGLEPPRHLNVFSTTSLAECARKAGFVPTVLRSSARMARGIWLESQAIIERKNGEPGSAPKWKAWGFQAYEQIFRSSRREFGEELMLVATGIVPTHPDCAVGPTFLD